MRTRKEDSMSYVLHMAFYLGGAVFVAIFFLLFINTSFGMAEDLVQMKTEANELKANLKEVSSCISDKNIEGAEIATDKLDSTIKKIDDTLASDSWKNAQKIPIVGEYVSSVYNLMDIIDVASGEIIRPALKVLKEHPLDEMKYDDGQFNVYTIKAYIELLEALDPAIDQIIEHLDGVKLPDSMAGELTEYLNKIVSVTSSYEEAEEYIPILKTFIGDGSDKTYVLAAQNSSEIRASGGFPGSIGYIEIKDGILSIGDFKSVYDVLYTWTDAKANVTAIEEELFGSWMRNPRDAVFDPDFERVAYIWALAYERENNKKVDGVVSLTPTIIQSLLTYIGPVTLSDGTELDGTNATRILQHDLYYKYLGRNPAPGGDKMADALFAETAKITMSRLVDDFNLERIAGYLSIFSQGSKDRTIMMWMANEEEQEKVREAGCSGGLNSDENKPEAGVYFSTNDPCKMGWYLDINTEISKPVLNEDESLTYEIKVTLVDTMTVEEMREASDYIIGAYSGGIRGYLHLFAPAGGTISDIETSSGDAMHRAEYQGLQVAYKFGVAVDPGRDFVVTYKVTTAPGVKTVLGISQTPTLQDYR